MDYQTLQQTVTSLEQSLAGLPTTWSATTYFALGAMVAGVASVAAVIWRENRGHCHPRIGGASMVTAFFGFAISIAGTMYDASHRPLQQAWLDRHYADYATLVRWAEGEPRPNPSRFVVIRTIDEAKSELRDIAKLKRAAAALGIAKNLADLPAAEREMLLAQMNER